MNSKTVAMSLMLALLCSGCASVIKGTHQSVGVSSSPSGIPFTVAGMTHTTPAIVKLKRNADHIIAFDHQGYEATTGTVVHEFSPAIFGNLLLIYGAIPGFVIDLATGASHNLEPSNVHMTLQPKAAR